MTDPTLVDVQASDALPSGTDEPVDVQRVALARDLTLTIVGPAGEASSAPTRVPLQNRLSKISALGKGAMGEVWMARDAGLCRKVAYKQMLPEHASNEAMAARFFEEVQVTAQLDHPNILPIYNLECTPEGAPAYSMKLVQGRTLSALLAEAVEQSTGKGFDVHARLAGHLDIFVRICDGMAYAHSKGVLHRDLKPDNIMVGRFNEVYVMDWGICRVMSQPEASDPSLVDQTAMVDISSSGSQRTQFGSVIGTPAYMSPEQALGLNSSLDGRSDLYTLGLILQEIVTLKRARHATQLREMVRKAAQGENEPLTPRVAGHPCPQELKAIIAKATATQVGDRYGSVAELAADIRRYQQGDAVMARPDTPMQGVLRYIGRHRRATLVSVVMLVLIGAMSTLGVKWQADHRRFLLELERDALNQFVVLGTRRQKAMDDQLEAYRTALAQLAGRAVQWVEAPPVKTAPYYMVEQFDREAAPGLVQADHYGMSVSVQVPVVKLSPDLSVPDVRPTLERVGTLNPAFRNVMVRAAGMTPETMTVAELDAWLLGSDTPLHQASLTLANGVYVAFPGHGQFPAEYDGRTRPKYKVSEGHAGVRWGAPYPDRYGAGLLLPASVGLFDDRHRFIGVASIDVRFKQLTKSLLDAKYPLFVNEVLLLDANGRVMMRQSPRASSPVSAATPVQPDAPQPVFEHFNAFNLDQRRDFGAVDVRSDDEYIGYFFLQSMGWYYVVIADRSGLIEHYRGQ